MGRSIGGIVEGSVAGFVEDEEVKDAMMDRIEPRPAQRPAPDPSEARANKTRADARSGPMRSKPKAIRSRVRVRGVEKSTAREMRRGGGLASARDRRRLRELNAAERARVEKMLASAPVPLDPDPRDREPLRERGFAALRSVPPPRCPVCGGSDLHFDEVMHAGALRLAQCARCEHRWTERPRSRWAELGARMSRARTSGRASEPIVSTPIPAETTLRLVSDPDADMLRDLPF
jgi:hypothetical protein